MFYDNQIYEGIANGQERWARYNTLHSLIIANKKHQESFANYLTKRFKQEKCMVIEITPDMSKEEAIDIMEKLKVECERRHKLCIRNKAIEVQSLDKKPQGIRLIVRGHLKTIKEQLHFLLCVGGSADIKIFIFNTNMKVNDLIETCVWASIGLTDNFATFTKHYSGNTFTVYNRAQLIKGKM